MFLFRSHDYAVDLLAGVPYYVELYQLSTDKQTTLKLSFDVKCEVKGKKNSVLKESPITKVNVVHEIPSE